MRNFLEEGHAVFRMMDVVEALDIVCITERRKKKRVEAQSDELWPDGVGAMACSSGLVVLLVLFVHFHLVRRAIG